MRGPDQRKVVFCVSNKVKMWLLTHLMGAFMVSGNSGTFVSTKQSTLLDKHVTRYSVPYVPPLQFGTYCAVLYWRAVGRRLISRASFMCGSATASIPSSHWRV